MKRNTIVITALVVVAALAIAYLIINPLNKQEVVYVDIIKLFNGFNFKTERQAQYDKEKTAFQSRLDTLELHYTATEKAFERSGDKTLEDRLYVTADYYQEMEYVFQNRLDSLDKKFNDEIWGRINAYMQDFGKEKKYDVIIGASGSGSVMYGSPEYDVTDDALEFINKKYEGEQ